MIKLLRTDASDQKFIQLVALLDIELAGRDGEEHSFYDQFNHIDNLKHVVLLKKANVVIGCGAIKKINQEAVEVKRMFVLKEERRRGFAGTILSELEKWALELGYTSCLLETGKRQPEAILLYERKGYQSIPNYDQYAGVENSICFEKRLKES